MGEPERVLPTCHAVLSFITPNIIRAFRLDLTLPWWFPGMPCRLILRSVLRTLVLSSHLSPLKAEARAAIVRACEERTLHFPLT